MRARVLMVQGTASSVGKSWIVTALCRIFARRGWRVAPFKAQNMSNNAAVCPDGAEIGRAQALQARAAGISPTADMNPILLKPEADSRSQVIVLGRPWRTLEAGTFYQHKKTLWPVVTAALERLRQQYELIIIEGAGSPVELNLKASDIVNMAVARHAHAPVLLVGDIDRGGIFAQLLGTLWLLPPQEQTLIRGFIVNKFRGDYRLFEAGVRILEARGQRPVLGVIPYLNDLLLPEEDAATLPAVPLSRTSRPTLDIAIMHLPRIANFDDFDPLRAEPDVQVRFVTHLEQLGHPDAIIIPGSKSTIADLRWLEQKGLAAAIRRLAVQGVAVVGICGGYQMLGEAIHDPERVEANETHVPGLGLLPVVTTFVREKATFQVQVRVRGEAPWLAPLTGTLMTGYEIHMGRTSSHHPWLEIVQRNGRPTRVPDGALSPDGRIWGCYIHGLFANDAFRHAWLDFLRRQRSAHCPVTPLPSTEARIEASLDRLATVVEEALAMEHIERLLAEQTP